MSRLHAIFLSLKFYVIQYRTFFTAKKASVLII